MNRDFEQLLGKTLRANAFFSGISGITGLLAATRLAAFLGLPSASDVLPTAVSLIFFSAWLFWLSSRRPVPRKQAIVVAAMDWLWVFGSVPVVLGASSLLTDGGRWLMGVLALIVADFAAIQTWALVRLMAPRNVRS